jgi:hypothetical protein
MTVAPETDELRQSHRRRTRRPTSIHAVHLADCSPLRPEVVRLADGGDGRLGQH